MLVANKTAEIKIWDTACHSVLIFNGIWQWKLERDSSPVTASTAGRTKLVSHVVPMQKCRRHIVLVFTLAKVIYYILRCACFRPKTRYINLCLCNNYCRNEVLAAGCRRVCPWLRPVCPGQWQCSGLVSCQPTIGQRSPPTPQYSHQATSRKNI